jgi:hypothetical protein
VCVARNLKSRTPSPSSLYFSANPTTNSSSRSRSPSPRRLTMRTCFLATEYFAPSAAEASPDQAVALAALPFPSLPAPTLPPDPYLPDPGPFPADLLPAAIVSGDELDSFPAASALSEFHAAVFPQPLPVPDIPDADEVSPPRLRGSRYLVVWVRLVGCSDCRGGLCGFVQFRDSPLEPCGICRLFNCSCISRREWMVISTAGAGIARVLAGRILLRTASPR